MSRKTNFTKITPMCCLILKLATIAVPRGIFNLLS